MISNFHERIELRWKDIFLLYPSISKKVRLQIKDLLLNSTLEKGYSHKINGRWENQYLDLDLISEIKPVFSIACKAGKIIINKSLVMPHKQLGFPYNEFWFNISNKGDNTGWHDHKENAKISGVYYISIPKKSGNIIFRKKNGGNFKIWNIKPKNGMMILFPSKLEHCVEKNESSDPRISLAFNLYTLPVQVNETKSVYSSKKFFS